MDELVGGMANEAGLMADAIKSITGVNTESPARKKQRQLTSITANIKLLYKEDEGMHLHTSRKQYESERL